MHSAVCVWNVSVPCHRHTTLYEPFINVTLQEGCSSANLYYLLFILSNSLIFLFPFLLYHPTTCNLKVSICPYVMLLLNFFVYVSGVGGGGGNLGLPQPPLKYKPH